MKTSFQRLFRSKSPHGRTVTRNYIRIFLTLQSSFQTVIIISNSSQGGESQTKTDGKLACKAVFAWLSTSGECPMLLVRGTRARRCPPRGLQHYSQGGKSQTKTDGKLACKAVFSWLSTSGGRPMLLARGTRARRCPRGLQYYSQGGESQAKTDGKLACKAVFAWLSTSGERPMLLARGTRARRCPPWIAA